MCNPSTLTEDRHTCIIAEKPAERQIMNKEKISDALDRLCDANAILEMCRGYTQADNPDMKMMDVALYSLVRTYEEIYQQLLDAK